MKAIWSIEVRPEIMYAAVDPQQYAAELASADRFIAFSAEVLRLALLGIAGVGFLLKSDLLGGSDHGVAVILSLACFSLAAACALGHRYLVTHALMYYFFGLRIRNANESEDPEELLRKRRRWLRMGPALKASSAILLGAGALTVAALMAPSL